jgi:hypothetical protein
LTEYFIGNANKILGVLLSAYHDVTEN